MDAPIRVENLGKAYRVRAESGRGGRWWRFARRREFWALRGLNFEVGAGEALGVIGRNGAGKSTLLRMLGGVGKPSEGRLEARGRMGALLELGGGFLGHLTGRENAVLAGVVAGLLREEVEERIDEIAAFAGIDDFLDEPVRSYSTGMTMRLAFSVVVHSQPEILLVDEFLTVGDLAFQARCRRRIEALRSDGCAIVMVAHGMDQIRELCEQALWLQQGRVRAQGAAAEVADRYEEELRQESLRRTPEQPVKRLPGGVELEARRNRFGSAEVEIESVRLAPGHAIHSGDALAVSIGYRAKRRVESPIFVVAIEDDEGRVVLDANTEADRVLFDEVEGAGELRLEFDRLDLARGEYRLSVGVFERGWEFAYDYHWGAYGLRVEGSVGGKGVLAAPRRWRAGLSAACQPGDFTRPRSAACPP